MDRADLLIEIPLPGESVIFQILKKAVKELEVKNILKESTAKHIFESSLLHLSQKASEYKISGRNIKKLPFLSCIGYEIPMNSLDFLNNLENIVDNYGLRG